MSYSRRQLEALGEPLGDCVTRKEGGRIIYGGGGSSSPPATQTQVTDLPDWAKPTAQKLLSKAEALVEGSPYQQYKGERIAGFSPLQQQAFQGAAQMDAGPQGFAQQVGQYMSPYMQNVVDREKMEAYRASQMLGQQQQARATQAGAFGGYREGIERAERERGLRSQLGDIQTRGLQSAYDRAADQFRTGITQGLAVGQQQAALGGQQQQREQNVMSQQYQDFQNQQRYPYQQLEYLSGILRGTPMGTVSTLYGGQPNTLGQIAGLGAGLYGAFGKAEGGMVDSYAEGGVTSDENVENILSKLSDAQLMQAKQIAMAQRDAERVQMIDAELAERASMKQGLGGAFNMLPQEQQDAVTEMAGGGIVAFADGGDVERYQFGGLTPVERARMERLDAEALARAQERGIPVTPLAPGLLPEGSLLGMAQRSSVFPEGSLLGMFRSATMADPATQQAIEAERAARETSTREAAAREARQKEIANYPKGIVPMTAPMSATNTGRKGGAPAPADRPVDVAKAAPAKAPGKGVQAAANAVANAAQQTTGVNRTEMKAAFNEGLGLLKDTQGEADSKRMVELINKISKSEAPDKMDMLANFGFKMAAAASKPGATFLGAAAEGAQVVPEMRAQAKKDAKEAQRLGITLEMEKLKFDAATRKGDRAAALQHAQNIRIMQGQEAQLGETKRSNLAREGLERQKIAAAKERAAAQQGRMTETMARIRAANAQKAMVEARRGWSDTLERKKLEAEFGTGQTGFAKYHKSLVDALQLQSLPQLELLGAVSSNTD